MHPSLSIANFSHLPLFKVSGCYIRALSCKDVAVYPEADILHLVAHGKSSM
jgi:hypothetical protein